MNGAILDLKTLQLSREDLKPILDLDINWSLFETTQPHEVKKHIDSAEVVLTNKVVLGENLSGLKVKYIGVLATGTNNVDHSHCEKNNIKVKNAIGYSTDSVAQHTLTMMLNLATSQHLYAQDCKNGRWGQSDIFCRLDHPIFELRNKTLGIIGYGNIAKKVISLAEAFGMKTLIAESLQDNKQNDNRTPLKKLIQQSDFISIHCPLTEKTRGFVDSNFLHQMKNSAFLINTSRGPVINESDLVEAIKSKQISGAAIDVLETEPPKLDSEIVSKPLDNLLVTPHTAWASYESRLRLIQITASNLQEFLDQKA